MIDHALVLLDILQLLGDLLGILLTVFLADIYLLWTKGEPFNRLCHRF